MIKILVVESGSGDGCSGLAHVAPPPGCAVTGRAGRGGAALTWLSQNPVDLVLFDTDLPDMSDLTFMRTIRGRGDIVDLFAVIEVGDPAILRASQCYGVLHCLIKPVTSAAIHHGLERYRAYRDNLAHCGKLVLQAEIDDLLSSMHGRGRSRLPKGISRESLNPVFTELQAADRETGVSAAEAARIVGTSRVTARRYLEYLADAGLAQRVVRYGCTGRPEVGYHWHERDRHVPKFGQVVGDSAPAG